MPNFLDVVSRAARSRFWLTIATVWLVGWLSLGSGHVLLHDCDTVKSHCGNESLPSHAQTDSSCALCQIGNLPVLLPAGLGQLVFAQPLTYFVTAEPMVEADLLSPHITPFSPRGPPQQPIFS